jgi:pimeloyl-ACP methyl ester carboxylesterase
VVLVELIVVPSCVTVRVPVDRDEPAGPTLDIAVVTIVPPEIDAADPMVVVGETLGGELDYGGLAPLATRTGRVIHLVARRGTGIGEPDLSCPELDPLGRELSGRPSLDPVSLDAIRTAVAACRRRLGDTGIDSAGFDLATSAADLEDVRRALGIEAWNAIGFGSASRLAIALARRAPTATRTMALDSPVLSARGDPLVNVAATDHAVDALAELCRADAGCSAALPDLEATLGSVLDRLDRSALRVVVDGGDTVVLDGTRVARAIRSIVGDQGGHRLAFATGALDRLDRGAVAPDDPLVAYVRTEEGLCFGHLPLCRQMVDGSMLTMVCRDLLPFVGADPDPSAAAGMGRAFRLDDWRAACDAWDVDPAPAEVGGPVAVPALAIAGRIDPFTGPLDALVGGADLGDARILEVPRQGYNAFGFDECPRLVRRFWLDHLATNGLDTSCFGAMRPLDVWAAP